MYLQGRTRDGNVGNRPVDTGVAGEGRVDRGSSIGIHTLLRVKQWPAGREASAQRREPSLARGDSLDGRDRRWVGGSRGILRQKKHKTKFDTENFKENFKQSDIKDLFQ